MFNLSKDEITFEVVESFCREWPEGVRVEYKKEIKDIPKIVSSFANTQGGVFIIGIEANQTDNKVVFPIEGIPETVGIEESIIQSAYEGIHPSIIPEVIKVDVPESKNIVVIVRVDESVSAPHAIQNSTRVYVRVESITQPYKKPELAEIDRIEYLFKRRQDTQITTQQILDRIEDRVQQVCDMNTPTMKVIARPVFAYRPVISPTSIFDLYQTHAYIKRVPGGICRFTEPSRHNNQELSDDYLELNEYGIVYYATRLYEIEKEFISVDGFIKGIDKLLQYAKKLYNACDTLVNIEVIAELDKVFKWKLWKYIGSNGHISLSSEPVCYASEVFASTSKTYLSRDFNDLSHQKTIVEELSKQLLWAFNMPTDNENIIKLVRKVIENPY